MGCAFVKPRNVEIYPANNLNNNSAREKQGQGSCEEGYLESSEKPMVDQDKGEARMEKERHPIKAETPDPSSQSPEMNTGREAPSPQRTSSGHLIPQAVDSSNLGEGFLSVDELYNVMNDGQRMPYLHDTSYMLILDARDRETFQEQHITTARHCSAVDSEFDCLISQGKLEKFMMIVVYDQSSTVKDIDPMLATFVQRLQGGSNNVMILNGGYGSFHQTYPFLCNNLTIRSEKDRMQLFKSYPSVVLEGALYQGNVKHSLDKGILENLNITHVLNVSTECKNAFPGSFKYRQVTVEDETSAQLGPSFQGAVDFIREAIGNGGRVFVHCVQGKSRSSSCTIAYLMSSRGWSLKDSHDYLKERRSIAAPNRGFLIQLSKFEESVFGKVLSSVDDLYF